MNIFQQHFKKIAGHLYYESRLFMTVTAKSFCLFVSLSVKARVLSKFDHGLTTSEGKEVSLTVVNCPRQLGEKYSSVVSVMSTPDHILSGASADSETKSLNFTDNMASTDVSTLYTWLEFIVSFPQHWPSNVALEVHGSVYTNVNDKECRILCQ